MDILLFEQQNNNILLVITTAVLWADVRPCIAATSFPLIEAVTQPCVQWSNNGGPSINVPPMRYVATRRRCNVSGLEGESAGTIARHAERCMSESG